MSVLKIEVQGGTGGIACADITAILPDVNDPENSVVYTSVFPSGLSVQGRAWAHCAVWWAWMESDDETDDETEVTATPVSASYSECDVEQMLGRIKRLNDRLLVQQATIAELKGGTE